MAKQDISQFHGQVRKCHCGIVDHPEKVGERACKACYNRGYLATCTACNGDGQITQAMAGGPGTMKSTCSSCGGAGSFGVNKPADWVDAVPETVEAVA